MERRGTGVGRRDWLKLTGAAGAVSVAGCLSDLPGGGGPDGWRQFRQDAANSGVASGAGPGTAPGTAWEFETTALLDAEGEVTPVQRQVSSPVVADGTVVVNAAAGALVDGEQAFGGAVIALDAATGDVVWQRERPPLRGSEVSDPVVVEDNVVTSWYDFEEGHATLSTLDLATGETVEERRFDDHLATVTAGSDRLYVGAGETLRAFAPSDLRTEWSTGLERRARVVDHPAVADGRVLLASGHEFRAFDAETGDELWRAPFEVIDRLYLNGGPAPFADPVVVDGTAYAAGAPRTLYNRAEAGLVAFDPATGDERWRFKPEVDDDGQNSVSFSAVYGYPVVVDGSVYATGNRGVYSKVGGRMQVTSQETLAFEFDADGGDLLEEHALEVEVLTPVSAGEEVYAPTQEDVTVVADGRSDSTSHDLNPLLARSPAVHDGRLYVATMSGLVAFEG